MPQRIRCAPVRVYTPRVRAALLSVIAAWGAPIREFLPWVEAVVARGPTPPSGPLRHDLLLGPGRLGITLFASTRDPTLEALAIDRARGWGDRFVALVEAIVDAEEGRHVGLRWTEEGGFTLKLYGADGETGVDVSAHGAHRRRVYRRVEPPSRLESDSLMGYSHTIEARLTPDASLTGVGKTTTAIIFGPRAPVSSLDIAAGRLRQGATPWADLPPAARHPLMGDLRAAALELDIHEDGQESFDVLVTFGPAASPRRGTE
jgi:hypothetical protein